MKIVKYYVKLFYLLTLFLGILSLSKTNDEPDTGNILNVHIIPHTHDDAGWLFTFDSYYKGENTFGCVECTLNTMFSSLMQDPSKTFTYVEIGFFEKWYSELNSNDKEKVKTLVKENRLEFLNGGWVMNDEADAHYQHIIDQMRLGMQFLKKEFNVVPKTAWYLDPFGHSLSNTYLMSKLGFENLVIVRIDYREKEIRKNTKSMEFFWRPYKEIDGGKSSILTHTTYKHYNPDSQAFSGFLESYVLPEYRIRENLEAAYRDFLDRRKAYKTNEIFFLYGDDFTFRNDAAFQNMDIFIKLMNEKFKDKVNVFYSSPSRYFKKINELNANNKLNFPFYDDRDFFPYSDQEDDVWTGYFTSRPYLKGIIRDAGNYLAQASQFVFNFILRNKKILKQKTSNLENNQAYTVYNFLKKPKDDSLITVVLKKFDDLRRELAIAQHHDAVTGTAREIVSEDYINRLGNGINSISELMKLLIANEKAFVPKDLSSFELCLDSVAYLKCLNKVFQEAQLDKRVLLSLINPGYTGLYPKRIKINFDPNSFKKIRLIELNIDKVKDIPFDLFHDDKLNYYYIYFIVDFSEEHPYKNYILKTESAQQEKISANVIKHESLQDYNSASRPYSLSSELQEDITFYLENNRINMKKVLKNKNNQEYFISLSHGYFDYNPQGKNYQGAYLMATNSDIPLNFRLEAAESHISVGKIITVITLRYAYSTLAIKIYNNNKNLEFSNKRRNLFDIESTLHKYFPVNNPQQEFVLIIDSNIDNTSSKENYTDKTEFFTDTNSMRIIKRIQDFREYFKIQSRIEKVSGNFYPVNSVFYIVDKNDNTKKLTVFNDRAQAATSLHTGSIYFDINRYGNRDDRKGLADGIYEEHSNKNDFIVNHLLAISDDFNYNDVYNYLNKKPLTLIYEDYFNKNKHTELDSQLFSFQARNNFNKLATEENFDQSEKIKQINKNKLKANEAIQPASSFMELESLVSSYKHQGKKNAIYELSNENCLEVNYYFISPTQVLIQFYNKSDPYFVQHQNCSVRFKHHVSYTIKRANLNSVEIVNEDIFAAVQNSRSFLATSNNPDGPLAKAIEVKIPVQDFETVIVEFK